MLRCCSASSGAAADCITASHSGCSSAKVFSLVWPASRQRSPNSCSRREKPRQSSSSAVLLASAQARSSSINARRLARVSAACSLRLSNHASTTLCASLHASSKRFHIEWFGTPPWSVCFHCSRKVRSASCIFLPPIACPGGRVRSAWARPTSSSRNWSARQRCQPSNSPAAASAAWAWFSSRSSIRRPDSLSALRSAAAAPALALPWPSAISASSLASTSRTAALAWARSSGSTFGFCALGDASAGMPRAWRSSSAQTGTDGRGAVASPAAATAWASAD